MSQRTLVYTVFLLITILTSGKAVATDPAWKYDIDGNVAATPVKFGDQILVAGGHTLTSLNMDGSESWTMQLQGAILSTPGLGDGRIYIHTSAGLTALNGQHEEIWHYPAEDLGALVDGRTWGWGNVIKGDPWAYYRSSPLVTDTAIVFGNSDGVHAVNPETGERLWYRPTGPVTTDIVGVEDSVLVADWNNSLRRLALTDGSVEWTFEALPPHGAYSSWIGWIGLNLTPVVADGHAFFGSRGTYFYAVNLESGRESWSNKHGTSWIGSAAIIDETDVFFGLSDGKGVIGIERASGNQSLFVPAPGPIFATPVLSGDFLIAGTLMGEVLVIDLEQGRVVNTHKLHDSQKPYNSYFQPDPDSTLTPYEYTVQQMDVMKKEQRSVLSMSVIGGLLIVGTGNGDVLAFELDALVGQP